MIKEVLHQLHDIMSFDLSVWMSLSWLYQVSKTWHRRMVAYQTEVSRDITKPVSRNYPRILAVGKQSSEDLRIFCLFNAMITQGLSSPTLDMRFLFDAPLHFRFHVKSNAVLQYMFFLAGRRGLGWNEAVKFIQPMGILSTKLKGVWQAGTLVNTITDTDMLQLNVFALMSEDLVVNRDLVAFATGRKRVLHDPLFDRGLNYETVLVALVVFGKQDRLRDLLNAEQWAFWNNHLTIELKYFRVPFLPYPLGDRWERFFRRPFLAVCTEIVNALLPPPAAAGTTTEVTTEVRENTVSLFFRRDDKTVELTLVIPLLMSALLVDVKLVLGFFQFLETLGDQETVLPALMTAQETALGLLFQTHQMNRDDSRALMKACPLVDIGGLIDLNDNTYMGAEMLIDLMEMRGRTVSDLMILSAELVRPHSALFFALLRRYPQQLTYDGLLTETANLAMDVPGLADYVWDAKEGFLRDFSFTEPPSAAQLRVAATLWDVPCKQIHILPYFQRGLTLAFQEKMVVPAQPHPTTALFDAILKERQKATRRGDRDPAVDIIYGYFGASHEEDEEDSSSMDFD